MTAEAQAVVRKLFDLAGDRDYGRIAELLDPEVVWFGTVGGLDAHRVVRGAEAYLAYLQEIVETWERLDVETEELIEAGDSVVAFLREKGHAHQGGPEVHNATAVIITVRHGRIVEARGYLDRDEALTAAGVTDQEPESMELGGLEPPTS